MTLSNDYHRSLIDRLTARQQYEADYNARNRRLFWTCAGLIAFWAVALTALLGFLA